MKEKQIIAKHKRIDEYVSQNKLDLAKGLLEEVMSDHPDYQYIHIIYNQYGGVLYQQKQYEAAKEYFEKAIERCKSYTEGLNNLVVYYKNIGDNLKVIQYLERLNNLKPNDPQIYEDFGYAYENLGDMSKAISYYERALKINPYNRGCNNNMGSILVRQGKADEAIPYFQRAVQMEIPSLYNNLFYSNILLTLNYSTSYSDEQIFKEHMNFDHLFGKPLKNTLCPPMNSVDTNRKIRIGYVSADFKTHSVAYFALPIIAMHNKGKYEIYCYSDVKQHDEVTEQFISHATVWRDIKDLDHEEAANLIRRDQIDILVDLAGHTGNNRLMVFAMKPAPIQVSWIGYPNTTGLKTMDYRITDKYADPIGMTDQYHVEKLIRMPKSFLCYAAPADVPGVKERSRTKEDTIVFASFNNFAKVSDRIIDIWRRILMQVPDSTLLIKSPIISDQEAIKQIKQRFIDNGLTDDRVQFMPRDNSLQDHWQRYNNVDIALDTFPYHGTTTTCEAVYMGVPVLTLAGSRHSSRVGVSLLTNIGCMELIAYTTEEYIEKAVELAKDAQRLRHYKQNLRRQMAQSALMQPEPFTRELEKKYREIWKTWCNSQDKNENSLQSQSIQTVESEKIDKVLQLLDSAGEQVINVLEELKSGKLTESMKRSMNIFETLNEIKEMLKVSQDEAVVHLNESIGKCLEIILKAYEANDQANIIRAYDAALAPAIGKLKAVLQNNESDSEDFDSLNMFNESNVLSEGSTISPVERKLHIGGVIRVQGWEVFNALKGHYVDHVGNAKDLSRFEDNTFDAIYASHVVEHFDYKDELLSVLKEWHRVLKPEAKLFISVPDLDVLAKLFTAKEEFDSDERFFIMRMIFGGHDNAYDYHVAGLNYEFLSSFLSKAGFINMRKVDSFGLFHDSSEIVYKGHKISLNITAEKLNTESAQFKTCDHTINNKNRKLHFLYTPYNFDHDSYKKYEYSNNEIVKYAKRHLEEFIPTEINSFQDSRVTNNPEDILLGHPTWDPTYSMKNNWVKDNAVSDGQKCHPNTYILVPWVPITPEEWHMPFLEEQLLNARLIFGLSGKIWYDKTMQLTDNSIQSRVKNKLVQVNMGCEAGLFPFKKEFSQKDRRNFLHISHLGSYKNMPLLFESIEGLDINLYIASDSLKGKGIGNAPIRGKDYQFISLGSVSNNDVYFNSFATETIDFYIHTSNYDAQATAILENCARGIVPILTPESGFSCPHAVMLANDPKVNRDIIQNAMNMSRDEYEERSIGVREHILKYHNWKDIYAKIWDTIQKDQRGECISYND